MIKPLTSLRFIFAFLVFLSHYLVDGTPFFSEGYIGVSFFFILSGFVLSYSYKDRLLNGLISNKEFFFARFARIYPLYFITFLASFILTILGASPIKWGQVVANITLLQSWFPLRDYYFSFNAPSWSISDEMFFYLMFPLLIVFAYMVKSIVKWCSLIFIMCCYGVAMFCMQNSTDIAHAFVYINPLFRILDFAIGIGVYQLWSEVKNNVIITKWLSNVWYATALEISSILLLVIMIFFSYDLPYIIRYSCYYWLPMALIIFVFAISSIVNGGGYISKFMSLKYTVFLGEISFGFYMIHVLVMTVFSYVYKKLDVSLPVFGHFLLVTFIIIGLSIASFYWFETPLNKKLKKIYKQKQDGTKISI